MREYRTQTPPDFSSLDLFAAASRARRNDRPTSRAAAQSLEAGSVLAAFADAYRRAGARGLTDLEAAEAVDADRDSCWWKRCSELRKAGLIVETGETRPGSRGRARIVCRWAGVRP
jgi:hypothetical protein